MTWKESANKYALCFWNSPFIGIMVIDKIFTISKIEKKKPRNILNWPFKFSIRFDFECIIFCLPYSVFSLIKNIAGRTKKQQNERSVLLSWK